MKPFSSPTIRLVALLLALLMPLSLMACGGDTAPSEDGTDTTETENETEAATDAATTEGEDDMVLSYTVTDNQGENGIDFVIDFEAGRDLRILQITDTQIQWLEGARPERYEPIKNTFFQDGIYDLETRVWRHMDQAVEKGKPDLIVLTGDNIYGEMDDSGTLWDQLCTKLDSYEIPWLMVFGNHDNESAKGVQWQVDRVLASEYAVFKQGNITGNSNYTVLLSQGGEALNLLMLFDSNGCVVRPNGESLNPDNVDMDKICGGYGPQDDQIAWMKSSAESAFASLGKRIPVLMFFHIPPTESGAAVDAKYPGTNSLLSNTVMPFRPDLEGDLGEAREGLNGFHHPLFWSTAKEIGVTDMFVGHQHKVATSIVYDGIRITYGLKTGTCDYHARTLIGSAVATVAAGAGTVTIQYNKFK